MNTVGMVFMRRGVLAILLTLALMLGLILRAWVWNASVDWRYESNVENAFTWGGRVLDGPDRKLAGTGELSWRNLWSGYRSLYASVDGDNQFAKARLDYPPLRLLVAAVWVRQVRLSEPGVTKWQPQYTQFMLNLNTLAGVAAAVCGGLLARHWARFRKNGVPGSRTFFSSADMRGIGAGLLIWLNAALLFEGYVWPQWDVWPVPFYLGALLCASRGGWTRAGALLAAGALLKGQLLFAAPLLILWPLFQMNWSALLRVLVGFAGIGTVGVAPWLVPRGWEAGLVVTACLLAAGLAWILLRRRERPVRLRLAILFGVGTLPIAIATIAALDAAASFSWFRVGYVTGTENRAVLSRNAACNMPAILGQSYGYSLDDVVLNGVVSENGIELKSLLVLGYGVALVTSAACAAWHATKKRATFLIAASAPWVFMFTLLGQMDGRYLIYAAAVSAALTGVSAAYTLLHLVLTVMNLAMMAKFLVRPIARQWPETAHLLSGIEPGMGWALMLTAAILLHGMFAKRTVEQYRTALTPCPPCSDILTASSPSPA